MYNIIRTSVCECVTRRIEKSGQKTDRQTDRRVESVGLCRGGLGVRVGDFHAQIQCVYIPST